MEHKVDDKSLVKSWLLRLLSELEVSEIENATQRESGHTITVEIIFKPSSFGGVAK